jgi:hypothetical protein
LAGLAAPVSVAPPASSAGTIVGAAVGGALFIVAIIGLAIRLRIVSAEINGKQVKSWRGGAKRIGKGPDIEINTNPLNAPADPALSLRFNRVIGQRKSSFGEVAQPVQQPMTITAI